MKNNLNVNWLYAALVRAIRTVAQTALGMFTIGLAFDEVKWKYVISVALVAGLYSMLTSIATELPEVSSGTLQIDTVNFKGKDIYRLELDEDIENLNKKKSVTLSINPDADLSQNDL